MQAHRRGLTKSDSEASRASGEPLRYRPAVFRAWNQPDFNACFSSSQKSIPLISGKFSPERQEVLFYSPFTGFHRASIPTLIQRCPVTSACRARGMSVLARRNLGPAVSPDTESTSRFSPTGLPAAGILRDVYTSPSKRTTTVAPVWDTVNSEMSPF